MPDLLANNFRHRRNFAKVHPAIDVHNLISIQRESYEKFLQLEVDPVERETSGLQAVFKSVFPIQDFGHRRPLGKRNSANYNTRKVCFRRKHNI